jgi:hypothetical protein
VQLDRSTRPCIDQQTRYTRYQIDDGRHRGDTERTYGGVVLYL